MAPIIVKLTIRILLGLVALYALLCCVMYFMQEKLIFIPDKLEKGYVFNFKSKFEEKYFKAADGALLHGLLFKADSSKGLIFYLHGNAGSLNDWGEIADYYTGLGYDLFMLDYRGYGKSEGTISNEKQIYSDVQMVYDNLKQQYQEDSMVIVGYSIGTGPATKLASDNHARLLVLQAPYYSLTDMMRHYYPILPTFLLKYQFETFKFLPKCTMPVVIFHGDQDEVIYYGSSLKLQKLFKKGDGLVTLNGGSHNGISELPAYQEAFKRIIDR
jgi:alpha-beta hydrolase superfamily lysophospholipase